MVKINYPKDRNKFEEDYKEISKISEDKWYKILKDIDCCTKRVFKTHNIKSLDDILVAPFDVLLKIYKVFPEQKAEKDKDGKKIKSEYEKLFDYEKFQPNIASFFTKYSKDLNLKTCYFCNLDYINVFSTKFDVIEYKTALDVIKGKNYEDLQKLKEIGKTLAQDISKSQKDINSYDDLLEIKNIGTATRKKIEENNKDITEIDFQNTKNHFTLDHFLSKSSCPILALSLYNFVPSCSSCNTKFKGVIKLEENYLSPTSNKFDVDSNVKFKLFFENKIDKKNFNLKINYTKNKDYEKYIKAFELEGCYKFHINEALTIIENKEKYSKTRIEEIANILNISSKQVKNDIFGKEVFNGDIQEKSFTKLKRDIYGKN